MVLDPELTDFCSRHNITPVIQQFQDDDDDDDDDGLNHPVSNKSNHSSDVEEQSKLEKFLQAFRAGQIAELKKENKKKRGRYSKNSKTTQKRRKLQQIELSSMGFYPLDHKTHDTGNDAPTPEFIDAVREESEESSDGANTPARDTCGYSSVNSDYSVSEAEDEDTLSVHNAWLHLRHHARIESKESSEGGDGDGDGVDGVRDHTERHTSEDKVRSDNEAHTMSEDLERLRHLLAHQDMAQRITGSTSQVLGDLSKLREASVQLTKEAKRGDLDTIVQARVAAIIGLLNIYTDEGLKYSWMGASEIAAKMQGRGTSYARRIRAWAINFLKWRTLPLHQLNQKRGTIIDDEDIAEELKTRMTEKAGKGFLKAQDVVDVVASPKMQEVFALKGISKPSISLKTALRWLENLGWTYGKLKNGMYLDGHERSDVVEYRRGFVERWMGYERRFHRWDQDGTELPRPDGFPVPGAIGRFRLILVTHDESTFFQNDERDTGWSHATSKSKPKAKGNGQSLMVSDFLTPDWGRLRDGDE
jgi:hypothetical protein